MDGEAPSVCYGPIDGGDAVFTRICPTCGRFVKADDEMMFRNDGEFNHEPNATCSRCGRVEMEFEGWY